MKSTIWSLVEDHRRTVKIIKFFEQLYPNGTVSIQLYKSNLIKLEKKIHLRRNEFLF